MRSKSFSRKKEILEFINKFFRENNKTPTFQDIGLALGINRATAYKYVIDMDKEGMLSYDNGTFITDVIEKCSHKKQSAPLIGSIGCSEPAEEEENIEEYIDLPESIFGKGDFFLLRAKGDSMVDAGIEPGNLIVIENTKNCSIGDIVVVLDNNGENTLKRYDGTKNGKPILSYMNKDKYPGCTVDVDSFICQGVARHIIKTI